MLKLILIGSGQWGQKYVSTLNAFKNINLIVANRDNWKSLIDEGCDGVLVCTPPESHIDIARYSILKDIPTMIEKPVALSCKALESIMLRGGGPPILVNHIHLFSTAYQNMKFIMSDTSHIDKIVSLGYNYGPVRSYSSLWDYGSHDVAMILDLMNTMPDQIQTSETITETGSLFNIKMNFGTVLTESLVGNGGAKKVRKLKAIYGGLSLAYDEQNRPEYHSLPLDNALTIFIRAINGYSDRRLGLDLAYKVTKVLEICQNNLNQSISINNGT